MSSRDRLADKWSLTQDRWIRLSMQSLLSSQKPHAIRKPCLNSHRVHGRRLVSAEGGDCSKRSNLFVCLLVCLFVCCQCAVLGSVSCHTASFTRVSVLMIAIATLVPPGLEVSLLLRTCYGTPVASTIRKMSEAFQKGTDSCTAFHIVADRASENERHLDSLCVQTK